MFDKSRHPPSNHYYWLIKERDIAPHLYITNEEYNGYFYTMLGVTTYLNRKYAEEIKQWIVDNE